MIYCRTLILGLRETRTTSTTCTTGSRESSSHFTHTNGRTTSTTRYATNDDKIPLRNTRKVVVLSLYAMRQTTYDVSYSIYELSEKLVTPMYDISSIARCQVNCT